VVQARPETVASRRDPAAWETFALAQSGPVLLTGRAVGEKIAAGRAHVITDQARLADFKPGEVLVASATSPDWEPVMKVAAAIITDRGGRTCHAAIVARELGVPAVVGATGATDLLKTGSAVTVDCAEGEVGYVHDGRLKFTVTRTAASDVRKPATSIMLNLGNPDLAFRSAMLPSDGVGLARMEFIISEHIGVHPMALAHPERVKAAEVRASIAQLVGNYARPADFFVERLAEGVGTIAAAFYPRPVIVRLSDFKTNEYARLLGGADFEPKEENPMIGFRGAAHVIQIDAFARLFDGFSIGSNDLTQLTLGVDRDSDIVAFDFDERDPGMLEMLRLAIVGAKRNGRHVGICGEAPANYPEIASFVAGLGIDSISVNPSSVFRTMAAVHAAQARLPAQSAA
jgi:pyruvate,water dikinase